MKQRILIIGASGFGRECLAWLEDVIASGREPDWEAGGFLDANPEALTKFAIDLPIRGNPADYVPEPQDRFICAIGDPATKLNICRSLKSRGAKFVNLIHPTAQIGPRCRIGEGLIMCPLSGLSVDITLGDFVTINGYAGVGHDAVLGDGCLLNAYCNVTGAAKLGEGVFMGGHAVVAPKVVVGDYARIGAGSVVVHRVRARSTVMGVPARRIEFESSESSESDSRAA